MRCLGIVILFFLWQGLATAQSRSAGSYEQELGRLAAYCDQMNHEERYEETQKTATKALQIVRPTDYYHQSIFTYYLGKVHDNNDTAIFYLEQSLKTARQDDNFIRQVKALTALCHLYNNVAGYELQRDETKIVLEAILDTTTNEQALDNIYRSLGNYYNVTGQHEKEMEYLIKSLGILIRQLNAGPATSSDSVNIGVNYMVIAEGFLAMGNYHKALQYAHDARVFLQQYKIGIAHYYKALSIAYLGLEQTPQMYLYSDSLTKLAQRENKYAYWEPRIALDLTFCDYFLTRGNTDSAIRYVQLSLSRDPKNIDVYIKASANLMFGELLLAQGKSTAALTHLSEAEKVGPDMGLDQYVHILLAKAKCYAQLGDWHQAAYYYEQYTPLRDSLFQQSSKQSIADAEAKFQNEIKQQKISTQQQQLAFAAQQRLWLIIGIGLALVIVGMLIVFYKNKKRVADELTQLNDQLKIANQTKSKLFSIIGHDLRAPVNQVYQFLKLQQRKTFIAPEEKELLSEKVQKAAAALLETMEDLLIWSKSQLSNFSINNSSTQIAPLVTQIVDLLQLNIEAKNITLINNIPTQARVITDSNMLHIILRNLIQNAINASAKHGIIELGYQPNTNEITISNQGSVFSQADFEAAIALSDTGKGLSGLGLKLIDELCAKLNIHLYFDNPVPDLTVARIGFAP